MSDFPPGYAELDDEPESVECDHCKGKGWTEDDFKCTACDGDGWYPNPILSDWLRDRIREKRNQ